jgi:hypothetical protein
MLAAATYQTLKIWEPIQVAAAKRWIQKTDSPMAGALDDGVDDDSLVALGPY